MAGSVNKVILVGNLGRDPEIRSTQDGMRIANLAVATSETWRDKMSGERKERTEWHRVVIFNERLAEVAEKYLKKGSKVYVEGALQTRKWTDNSGPGALHDRGRAAALPRRIDDARWRRGRPRRRRPADGRRLRRGRLRRRAARLRPAMPARGRTPVNDLDDDIPF